MLAGVLAAGAGAAPSTTPSTTPSKPGSGQTRSAADAAFCAQVTASQAIISKAPIDPKAKLAVAAKEWANIEKVTPPGIRSLVTQVRTAYETAAAAGDAAAVKTPAIASAGARITDYVAASCSRGGGDGGGPGGPDGFNDPARAKAIAALRTCLEKNGVKLPAPGQPPGQTQPTGQAGQAPQDARGAGPRGGALRGLDRNDPKVAAALKTCASLIPTGGFGGRGGPGGGNFAAIQACLQKKGVTLPGPGAGNNGGGANNGGSTNNGGPRPTFDAKTQKAFDECRQAAGNG